MSFEEHTSQVARALDRTSGFDALQILSDRAQGITSRVQFGPWAYDTFTIRAERASGHETELKKRLSALESEQGVMVPFWTVQAYVSRDGRSVLSAGAIKTRELYRYLDQCLPSILEDRHPFVRWGTNPVDGNLFISVPWGSLAREQSKEKFANLELAPLTWHPSRPVALAV